MMLTLALLVSVAQAGTVIVRSEPSGATVMIGDEEHGKTPTRLRLESGDYKLALTKDGYEKYEQELTVGSSIVKVQAKLSKPRRPIDVMFEDMTQTGWYLAVDGAPPASGFVLLPATVKLTDGMHTLTAVKVGYRDISIRLEVSEQLTELLIKDEPKYGRSSMRSLLLSTLLANKWYCKPWHSHRNAIFFYKNGTYLQQANYDYRGKWRITGDHTIHIEATKDAFDLVLKNGVLVGERSGAQKPYSWHLYPK
jgi:hypothetical protein